MYSRNNSTKWVSIGVNSHSYCCFFTNKFLFAVRTHQVFPFFLRTLLHEVRVLAVFAFLDHRLVPRNEVAFGIPRTAVKISFPFRLPFYNVSFFALRALEPHRNRLRMVALGVIGASQKSSEGTTFH